MRVAFATLGCKVNHYETQAMEALFRAAGWEVTDFDQQADVYVINTCTVTGVSDSKSRQLIARAHNKNPQALIAAVGCYAQSAPKTVEALPGVGLVMGTDGRAAIVERVEEALKKVQSTPLSDAAGSPTMPQAQTGAAAEPSVADSRGYHVFEPLSATADSRTRATLKIQDGCANYCAYCIIPYARGPIRSRSLADTKEQLFALADHGYREIVLTGIHLASYGRDLGDCDLLDVLSIARDVPGLERVRLGSLEPKFVDERVAQALADNPKICRQFHLSLQSGSDPVLQRMRRRYTTAEYAKAAALLRTYMPDCALTTDVIAGFCGETPEEHQQTLAFVKQMAFARIHVFPFSLRKGTAAASMGGQLPKAVKQARAKELIELGSQLTRDFLTARLGTTDTVLIEQEGFGYTGNYIRVHTDVTGREGQIVAVELVDLQDEIMIGKEISESYE